MLIKNAKSKPDEKEFDNQVSGEVLCGFSGSRSVICASMPNTLLFQVFLFPNSSKIDIL